MSKVQLYGKKEIRAAAYNRMTAGYFLKLAEKSEEGQFYTSQASLLFSAFTHEAFLNTLGPKIISFWKELEYLKPTQKLRIITKTLHYTPDFSERPYQTLKPLFDFRNAMAHGRDEEIHLDGMTVSKSASGVDYTKAVTAVWVAYCTFKNAKRAYEDIEKIARDLSDRAKVENMPNYPFGSPESSLLRITGESIARGTGARLIGKLTTVGSDRSGES
jgi:hypothetical protein